MRDWRAERPEAGADGHGPVAWARFQAVQAENAELKREVEFLGKVSAIFAGKHR